MNKPIRIQRKRTKGWRMPANTVYVGRPSKWGNPFKVYPNLLDGKLDYDLAVGMFKKNIEGILWRRGGGIIILKGKNLACWCPLDQPCHADILLKIANS